jgi:hypothetical protein
MAVPSTAAAAAAAPAFREHQPSPPASSLSAVDRAKSFNIRGTFASGRSVYLDMQATTPTDPRVLDAMLPFMTQQYGNPHSRTHHFGWEAEQAIEDARAQVARLIAADPKVRGQHTPTNESARSVVLATIVRHLPLTLLMFPACHAIVFAMSCINRKLCSRPVRRRATMPRSKVLRTSCPRRRSI